MILIGCLLSSIFIGMIILIALLWNSYIVAILGVVAAAIWLIYRAVRNNRKGLDEPVGQYVTYPHRPDVEKRLPNGFITTDGYAATHPGQFSHWVSGPENVLGESIDPLDWERWRKSYYGE